MGGFSCHLCGYIGNLDFDDNVCDICHRIACNDCFFDGQGMALSTCDDCDDSNGLPQNDENIQTPKIELYLVYKNIPIMGHDIFTSCIVDSKEKALSLVNEINSHKDTSVFEYAYKTYILNNDDSVQETIKDTKKTFYDAIKLKNREIEYKSKLKLLKQEYGK